MTRWRYATSALLVLASAAASALAAPPEIKGDVDVPAYKIVRLTAEGVAEKGGMRWRVKPLDPSVPASAVDWATETKSVKTLKFVAPPGRYSVVLITVTPGTPDGQFDLDEAEVIVTIGGAPPPPPPVDPLAGPLAAAYAADPSPTKAVDAKALAAVYRQAGRNGGAVDDPSLKTPADLLGLMQRAAAIVAPLPALRGVREAVAADLDTTLGRGAPATLDGPYRVKAKAQFLRIGILLEGLTR